MNFLDQRNDNYTNYESKSILELRIRRSREIYPMLSESKKLRKEIIEPFLLRSPVKLLNSRKGETAG